MPERPKRTPTGRANRTGPTGRGGVRSEDRLPADGDAESGGRSRPDAPHRILETFVDELFDRSRLLDPFRSFGGQFPLLLTQFLETQAVVLRAYQRALDECSPDMSPDDRLRRTARALMGAYLEITKTLPEQRERLFALHSALVKDYLEAIEALQRRLADLPS